MHAAVAPEKLYEINGLQFLPFNTLYQFTADPRVQEPGVQALLIPDLLGYWLTGERVTEDTNLSTTGLLDAQSGKLAPELVDALGIPAGLLARPVPPGAVVGELTDRDSSSDRSAAPRCADHRRIARHRLGHRRRAGRVSELRLHLLWHMGFGRR